MGRKKNISNFETAQTLITNIAGDSAIKLVQICEKKKKSVTDEEISKKLGIKVTEVRTILNMLHFWGITSYNKNKNKKTGWYTYTWEIKFGRITELLIENYLEKILKLEEKKRLEENYVFFTCKNQCEHHPFEIAAEYQFRCPECGGSMNPINNKKQLIKMNKKIDLMKEELEVVRKYS